MHKINKTLILLMCYALLGITLLSAVNYQTHTVGKGDNLYNLAKRYGVTVEQIKTLSNITSSKLKIGQELIIREEQTKTTSNSQPDSQPGINTYVVKKGDNLGFIAKQYGMTVTELKKLNDLQSNRIDVGQELKIRGDKTTSPQKAESPRELSEDNLYVVKRNDNLSNIAKQFGMTVDEIKNLNNLTDDRLDVGQKLKIKTEEPKQSPKKKTVEVTSETVGIPQDMQIEEIVYVVARNDNLSRIAKKYSTTVNEIKELNDLKSSKLSVGQKLKIQTLVPKPKKKKEPVTPPPSITANKPAKKTTAAVKDTTSIPKPAPVQMRKLTVDEMPDEYVYIVKPKDNLYRIALNNKIELKDLLRYNDFETDDTVISIGQKLIIKDPAALKPAPETEKQPAEETGNAEEEVRPASTDSVVIEKYYIVQRKDNLFRIAKEYGITVEELKRLNNLKNNNIVPGQKLYIVIPKGAKAPEDTTPGVTEEDLKTKSILRTDLIMPVDAKILSEYGIRNGRPHKGMDLGAQTGMPVFAVLDGTIVYSGLQGNYGNVVVIEHPEYVMTVYAHNEKNIVNVGDVVKQGQIIATVGSTGNATAPHVHFEYRIKGKAINPRKVLPLGK